MPQHPHGGRSGRLPYVREGGTLQSSLSSEADLIKSQFYGACANYNFLAQRAKMNLLLRILLFKSAAKGLDAQKFSK